MHAAASHATMAAVPHNNVASVRIPHNNIAIARGGESHKPAMSVTSVARLYICAYMPDDMARTMGCR
jgi:hypothetical protein